jgi:uncharacterized protein with FMN-binding domain
MHYRIRKLGPAAVGIAVSAALAACSPSADNAGAPMPSNSASPPLSGNRESPSPTPPPESAAGSDYDDGQYSADGQYGNLPSSIGVTVTLVDGVITDVAVTPHATDPTSLDLQNRFADAVPAVVVGRDIDEIRVDRIAGSSATPDGFNAALERIKAEATNGRTP